MSYGKYKIMTEVCPENETPTGLLKESVINSCMRMTYDDSGIDCCRKSHDVI